jgi:hypothetical protein
MSRRGSRWWVVWSLACLLGCSRSSGDSSADAGPSAQRPPSALPPLLPGSAEAPSPLGTGSVLTPEDAEEDAAHRITEENLESELDRLEREIQAE